MAAKRNSIKHIVLIALVSIVLVLSCWYLYTQNQSLQAQARFQKQKLAQQRALIEATRSSGMVPLMSELLRKADEELKANPDRSLSDELIAQIAALSHELKPYQHVAGDSLSIERLSPERGQLLLMLSRMNIDSLSFARIKLQVTFEGADLRGADLNEAQLQGALLKGANLKDAILRAANLQEANLYQANLWGANMRRANLRSADLKRADMSWGDLSEADLRQADLCSAILNSAKLNQADLSNSLFKWAFINDADLHEANLQDANLLRTELSRANLSGANLTNANLKRTIIREANFRGTILKGTSLFDASMLHTVVTEADWLEKLDEWEVVGAEGLQERFDLVKENTAQPSYRLEKPKE